MCVSYNLAHVSCTSTNKHFWGPDYRVARTRTERFATPN